MKIDPLTLWGVRSIFNKLMNNAKHFSVAIKEIACITTLYEKFSENKETNHVKEMHVKVKMQICFVENMSQIIVCDPDGLAKNKGHPRIAT